MKRNNNFVIREMGDKFILVPFGEKSIDFNGILTINESAKFLWEKSGEEFSKESLMEELITEYNIDESVASDAVEKFIDFLKEVDCLE